MLLALVPVLLLPFAAGIAVWLAPWEFSWAEWSWAVLSGPSASAQRWAGTDPLWAEVRFVLIAARQPVGLNLRGSATTGRR